MDFVPYHHSDLEELHELNTTLVDKWYKYNGTSRKKVKSKHQLSLKDRFMAGGPWLDIDCLSIHVEEMCKIGDIILLKDEETGELLGELEYHYYENLCHIDWMMVTKDRQHSGLGRSLLDWLTTQLQEGIDEIWTEPEDGVLEFYIKNGFSEAEPPYHRYKSQGTRELDDTKNWIEEIPNYEYGLGDDINDPRYRMMLLRTQVKYAELFDTEYPVRYKYCDSSGIEKILVERKLQPLLNKSSIFFLSHQPMIYGIDKTDFLLNEARQNIRAETLLYTTFLRSMDFGWKLIRTVPRLQRIIQH